VSKMLQNSPKRICDFKIFSGGYTPGPPLKRAGKGREGREGGKGGRGGGKERGGREGRGGEGGREGGEGRGGEEGSTPVCVCVCVCACMCIYDEANSDLSKTN
jgi:hypothetical protein